MNHSIPGKADSDENKEYDCWRSVWNR